MLAQEIILNSHTLNENHYKNRCNIQNSSAHKMQMNWSTFFLSKKDYILDFVVVAQSREILKYLEKHWL